jgi:hypothetical protein
MQDPEPPAPSRWIPTRKTVNGSVFGTALAQIIVAICDQYFSHPLTAELASAVTTVCVVGVAYFTPNASSS